MIQDIGHAFGYYDYGTERGLINAFPSREATAVYISGYVRMALRGGVLYTTSENGEAYIAYKLPGEKLSFSAMMCLVKGLFSSMGFKDFMRFLRIMGKTEPGLDKRFDKEKKPYIFVGMVCVREQYQGQGYMRRVMELAFAAGNRLGVPVILETDAKSKCDRYIHLGMELAGTHSCGEAGMLYDMIKYPEGEKK